ncbi:hypothetical protein PSDVSF_28080 [Pseudodesulfovibrio sediminis]|uniref:BioF2-like acetyltransferase domain-containing protein n=2 Tax=Pseudodesulfovibrio sediminis TaxID=2810563 RepID=A0ABM7P922_9BACT|nr:hypothetical protein PSDVSF_28080 [Pseudodesulfovibrio sediminis]
MAFHDAFSPDRRILIVSRSNSLVALAEHVSPQGETYLTPIESHWFFGCPLLGSQAVQLFNGLMDDIARLYAPAFPQIVISGIRPGGALSQRLIRTFIDRFDIYLHSSGAQCAASLAGGVDGYLSRRSGNHRKKLRKQARKALEQGVSFERVAPASAEEAETTYARMIAVELKSWKGIGKCGMAETPAKEFYDFLLKRLASAQSGRVIFARHDNKDIGFIFGGMAGRIYRGQQFSYDEAWKHYSIGNIMQLEQIRWLCQEKAKRYDMGPLVGPKMAYKNHWTEKEIRLQTWILVKRR